MPLILSILSKEETRFEMDAMLQSCGSLGLGGASLPPFLSSSLAECAAELWYWSHTHWDIMGVDIWPLWGSLFEDYSHVLEWQKIDATPMNPMGSAQALPLTVWKQKSGTAYPFWPAGMQPIKNEWYLKNGKSKGSRHKIVPFALT